MSVVFRGVQILQTAVSGLPVRQLRHGMAVEPARIVERPDPDTWRADFISETVMGLAFERQRVLAEVEGRGRLNHRLAESAASVGERFRRSRRHRQPRQALLVHGARIHVKRHHSSQILEGAGTVARHGAQSRRRARRSREPSTRAITNQGIFPRARIPRASSAPRSR